MSRIFKQDLQDLQEMSRIYKRRHDFQDEEENVGERKSLILFIVLIVKILLGIKKIAFMNTTLLSCKSCKSYNPARLSGLRGARR